MKPTIPPDYSRAHPGIKKDARTLGVSRITLWRVVSGRGKASHHAELLARYRALVAERQSKQERGLVLKAGLSFRADPAFAEELAGTFPDAVVRVGSRIEIVRPLVLAAPNHVPMQSAPGAISSGVRRVASAIVSAIRGNATPSASAARSSSATADRERAR